jgi:hypothetical protein
MKRPLKSLLALVLVQFALSPLCLLGQAPRPSADVPVELKNVCVYHPEPNWWGLARQGMHGVGVYQLTINPKNGEVTEVKVVRATRFGKLNAECIMTLFTWKFRPGTVTQAKVPLGFYLKGYFREIH